MNGESEVERFFFFFFFLFSVNTKGEKETLAHLSYQGPYC